MLTENRKYIITRLYATPLFHNSNTIQLILGDIIDDSNEEDIQKDTTERDEIAGGKRKLLIILRSFRLFNKHSQHTDTILGPT